MDVPIDRTENDLRDVMTKPLLKPNTSGLLKVPDRPGLGVEVNEVALKKYMVIE